MCWVRMPASSNRSLEKYGLTPKGTKFWCGIPETCGGWELGARDLFGVLVHSWPTGGPPPILYGPQAKNNVYFLKWLENINTRVIFCGV